MCIRDSPAVAGNPPAVAGDSKKTRAVNIAHSKLLVATIKFKDERAWFGDHVTLGALHYHNHLANRAAKFTPKHNDEFCQ